MNNKFIAAIAKKHPAFARAFEIGLFSMIFYVLGAFIEGEVFSWHALFVALLTPIYAYIGKKRRDLENK